jgi:hypothetical protein
MKKMASRALSDGTLKFTVPPTVISQLAFETWEVFLPHPVSTVYTFALSRERAGLTPYFDSNDKSKFRLVGKLVTFIITIGE